ncbi:hypothetical protein [Piscinibacter sp.]|jgi:membrane protein implicated in regulation of membrane protease activity|uniref:hypothetical protein n=1 Tax=Piscinibacter sp. TaxID=1903157 RepID=UPI002F42D5F6
MEQLPNRHGPQSSQPRPVRVIHISVQPKTWLGKLIAGIVGVAVMLLAFFLSILAFAIIASLVVVAIVYFMWVTHRARRAMRSQTIDSEVKSHDIY